MSDSLTAATTLDGPVRDNGGDLVVVRELVKHFPVRAGLFRRVTGYVKAVDGVSFDIRRKQTLGLVGESGCGKTTAGRTLLRLMEPTSGTVFFDGRDITDMGRKELRRARSEMQIIFQDPYSSLNPRMTAGAIVGEGLKIHHMAGGAALRERVNGLLERVGMGAEHASRYPHEFSGGQRQRIGIARAIALNPKFMVCDEPVSALDVSIQAQIINLLKDLQSEYDLSYLFIAHDLAVVRHISDRVAVMYMGMIVEFGSRDELFENPRHPYTLALLSAVPVPDPKSRRKRIVLEGGVPSAFDPPDYCRFYERGCPRRMPRCKERCPDLISVGEDHQVACFAIED
ncbi:MAG: ABC transporter ATP-binding protein [Alphaproteobacteria bacterium]